MDSPFFQKHKSSFSAFNKFMILITSIFIMTTIIQFVDPAVEVFAYAKENDKLKEELQKEIETIYSTRSSALVSGDAHKLKDLFDVSQKYGQWALEHEVRRVKYVKNWSKDRRMKFTNINSMVRIKKIYNRQRTVRVSLEESYKFDYIYITDSVPTINSFGVGIRHTLDLIKKDNKWFVYSDWYTDCFEDALASYNGNIANGPSPLNNTYLPVLSINIEKKYRPYDREKAAAYADKYCGAAWGSGNNFKYNKKYRDFNGIGGDCTNFISQVLGDKEGGSLPFDGGWFCTYSKYGDSQGSQAWVNASSMKQYLLYSGKGTVIKKGTFKELTAPTQDAPNGTVGKLQLGDLVCYEKKGHIDHFAVITGFDSKGYPLVNSHTTDRYHVPWDLGWGDKGVKFFLIHING